MGEKSVALSKKVSEPHGSEHARKMRPRRRLERYPANTRRPAIKHGFIKRVRRVDIVSGSGEIDGKSLRKKEIDAARPAPRVALEGAARWSESPVKSTVSITPLP